MGLVPTSLGHFILLRGYYNENEITVRVLTAAVSAVREKGCRAGEAGRRDAGMVG